MFNSYYYGDYLLKQKNEELEKISRTAWMWAKEPSTTKVDKRKERTIVKPTCCTAI